MIQNREFCGNQTHLDVPMSSDHSRSNQLTYSQMAEEVDLEERDQHNSITSSKASRQGGNPRGNRSYNIQISCNEDIFQRTNNLNFRSFAHDASNISGEGNNILKQGIYKHQKGLMPLGVDFFFNKVVQKQSDVESKILLKPIAKEQKKLGEVLLKSRFEGEKAYDLSKVQQQSQILQMQESLRDQFHFKAAVPDESGFDIFKKFQQLNAVQPEQNIQIKINGTKQKNQTVKKSSFEKLLEHDSHISSQKFMKSSKQAFDSFTLNDKNRSSSYKKDSSSALLGSKIIGSKNDLKLVYSNIPLPKSESKNQIGFRAEASKVQEKKPIIQVSSRMMSTYNPNNRASEFKLVVEEGSGKSEPDQHTNVKQSKKTLEPNKFIDPLTASLTSNEKLKNENSKLRKDLQEDLTNRINNVEKMFRLLKNEDRQLIPSKDNASNEQFYQSKFGNKLKSLQQMYPQDLFNGFSSIESDDKFSKRQSKANSIKISKQLQFITNKLMSLQKAVGNKLMREKSIQEVCEQNQKSQKLFGVPSFNSRTKLINRQKPISNQNVQINLSLIHEELQQQLLSLDSNRIALISQRQLSEIALKIFQVFRVPINKGKSMSVFQLKKSVRFYLSQQKIIANWDFSGILYIGKTSQPQYMIKQGFGTQIKLKNYVYRGNFKNNLKNGKGSIIYENGDKYEGQWKDNQYSGHGLLEMSESTYKGSFKNGLKHGKGHQIFNNQDVYEGIYEQDHFHEHGRYIWFNGPIYQGEFQSGVIEGTGTWHSPHGDIYVGQFEHGYGRYTWKSGSFFEGQFRKGRMIRKNKRILKPQRQLTEEISGQTQYVSPQKNMRFKSHSPIIRRFKVQQFNNERYTKRNHRFF